MIRRNGNSHVSHRAEAAWDVCVTAGAVRDRRAGEEFHEAGLRQSVAESVRSAGLPATEDAKADSAPSFD